MKLIGIDLFAGAGGMSLGASLAGIHVSVAVEKDRWSAKTYSQNHPETTVFQRDITLLSASEITSIIGKHRNHTVLFGGPPCQGFSYSNQRTRGKNNPENWLFLEFLRLVRSCRPDWVVFENVRGISDMEGGIFLENVERGFRKAGYTISTIILNAVNFGVPQNRSRFFIIASLHGIATMLTEKCVAKPITVSDAISDLPELGNGASDQWMEYGSKAKSMYAKEMRNRLGRSSNHLVTRNAEYIIDRYHYVPQGGNWENIPPRLMRNYQDRRKCHTGIYYRLKEDAPSIVIGNYRKNMVIHPTQDRGLSVREAARIQSFPDWYQFYGSIGFQQQQVGNAVPPLLAKAVFSSILEKYSSSVVEVASA